MESCKPQVSSSKRVIASKGDPECSDFYRNVLKGARKGFDTILPSVESLSLTTVKYFTNE